MSQESVEGGREGFPGPRFKGLTYTVGSGALYSFQLKNQSWVGWGRNSSLKNCPFPGCGDWKHLIRWWQFSCQVMSDSCNPIDCSPSSSVCGILQARILEWIAISFSRSSSGPRNRIWVSCIADRFSTNWATREAHLIRERGNEGHLASESRKEPGAERRWLCPFFLFEHPCGPYFVNLETIFS